MISFRTAAGPTSSSAFRASAATAPAPVAVPGSLACALAARLLSSPTSWTAKGAYRVKVILIAPG